MGLVETVTSKGNAEREKYLSVLEVIDIINSHKKYDIEVVISVMDSLGLFSLTVHELNSSKSHNPIYNPIDKPICSSYELKQKIRDYRKVAGQLDNYSEGEVYDEYITSQRFIRKILWSRFDLLKIEDIAKHTSLVVWSNSNALYIMYSDIINKTDSEYYELPKSTQQAIKDYMNLGSHQRELMKLVSYSPEQIICLMTNDDPAFITRDEKYRAYWDIIKAAFESNKLTHLDDSQDVESRQVQRWLKDNGLLYQKSYSNSLEKPMEVYDMRKRIDELEKEAADAKATGSFSMETPTSPQGDPKTLEKLRLELITANIKIADLKSKLAQTSTALADKPADSATHSNTDMQNVKKAAIHQFNRSLAMALIELDYQSKLRKSDIISFIMPHMKKLALALADGQEDKAKLLVVKSETICETHLQGLNFKQGRQSNADKNKVNIDLLFKKQLPITE